ncbi:MAG: hypothetical protein HZB56_15455 [Deltaproteobacteria bacterium]|nr:hypothetical protein [Deltaproteobacteria bacterium]
MTVCGLSRYKAALVAGFLALPGVSLAERVAGAAIPDDARLVEPNRYKLEKSYDDALKYYKAIYPPAKYPRRPIANQPGLKAVHIENPEARPGGWEGLNVYDIRGETRVFVLVMPGKKDPPRGR